MKEKRWKKRKEGKRGGWPAGPRRRRPEVAGYWRWAAKAPKPKARRGGASLVQKIFLEFCKWCFGGRAYSSLERVFRGEEDGVVGGDQDGVGGGGDGGEVLEVMGCFGWKWRKKMVMKMVL